MLTNPVAGYQRILAGETAELEGQMAQAIRPLVDELAAGNRSAEYPATAGCRLDNRYRLAVAATSLQ